MLAGVIMLTAARTQLSVLVSRFSDLGSTDVRFIDTCSQFFVLGAILDVPGYRFSVSVAVSSIC